MASKATSRAPKRAKRAAVRDALADLEVAASVARATADRLAAGSTGSGRARGDVLRTIAAGPLSVPAVARRLRQTRQSTQRLMDVLEANGSVQRLRNPDHRVSDLFTPTPAGLKLLARQDESVEALHRHLARNLTATDVDRLRAALTSIIELVDDYRERTA